MPLSSVAQTAIKDGFDWLRNLGIINELTACTQVLIVILLIIKCQTVKGLRNNGNLKD